MSSQQPEISTSAKLDSGELWEFFFGKLKGYVPDALTDELLGELADHLNSHYFSTREVTAEPVAFRYRSSYDRSWQFWPAEAWTQPWSSPYRESHPDAEPLYATPPVVEEAVKAESPRPLVDELTGALRFILAFYEPGQNYLDTNAWKVAEAGGRSALAKGEAFLTEQAAAANADALPARSATP